MTCFPSLLGDIDPHPEAKIRPGSGQMNALIASGVSSSSFLGKLSETELKRLVTKKVAHPIVLLDILSFCIHFSHWYLSIVPLFFIAFSSLSGTHFGLIGGGQFFLILTIFDTNSDSLLSWGAREWIICEWSWSGGFRGKKNQEPNYVGVFFLYQGEFSNNDLFFVDHSVED